MAGPYEKALTVPANTPEDKPKEDELEIEGDVVTKIELGYLTGPHNMVGVAIFYGIKQLWPVETGTWFKADDYTISLPISWDLPERKVTLTLKGCSPDTQFDHTVEIRVVTEDMPAAKPWKALVDFIAIIKKLIGLE